jgi:hypothetical protein
MKLPDKNNSNKFKTEILLDSVNIIVDVSIIYVSLEAAQKSSESWLNSDSNSS